MAAGELQFKVQEGVARLRLDRPQKRNALTRDLLSRLNHALVEIEARQDVRLLVLDASGPVFCAGMDLAEMQASSAAANAAALLRQDSQLYCDLVARLIFLPNPTIAVVQGPAVAGGLGLVLACDIVVASETALFSLPEPKRGIIAAIVTPLLNYRIGAGPAGYVLLSGKQVDAATAQRLGICAEVVPASQLQHAAAEQVEATLTGSPMAMRATKEQLLACAGASLLAQLSRAVEQSARARETADAEEGRIAFLEKRPPAWQPAHPLRGLDADP